MMVLPLLVILLLPKVFNPSDPEMRREMEQSMNMLNSNQELPDVSELMTKFFSSPKSDEKAGGGARGPRVELRVQGAELRGGKLKINMHCAPHVICRVKQKLRA
ncbi:ER membrane protein complex subunit 7-like [Onychostoma macrolepis]|uniref:ER membrane protein complex subunit 7-like n=1 Tax=Onychostoma macrolepis TaxID=369639 RepID=UPI00272D7754|nr:ER membrane protein complex subunit 7-like [Onychostoma macrolepis]